MKILNKLKEKYLWNIGYRLRFEKEIFFLKYLFTEPFYWVKENLTNINLLIYFELIIFFVLLFREPIIYVLKYFPVVFDNLCRALLALVIITLIYKAYSSQKFQEKYRKEKEEKIMMEE